MFSKLVFKIHIACIGIAAIRKVRQTSFSYFRVSFLVFDEKLITIPADKIKICGVLEKEVPDGLMD